MKDQMRYYNVEEFKAQKRQQAKGFQVPPRANFLAAANHIRDTFESKNIAYGIMGGLAMLCLGYRREMPDLQIAYDDRDFIRIKAKLEADQRVRLPDGMNSLFPSKILVRTGPAYKDAACTDAATIEVDLIPPGSHGTPPNGMLSNNLVTLSLKEPRLKTYKGLNMLHLVKTLVHYCRVRDLVWDPRKDILFLCQHYGANVQSVRNQLDQKAVQQNFLGTSLFSRLSPEDKRGCYLVLLGKDPPPVMAITAPQDGHRHSRSASELPLPTPRITVHKSSPALNTQTPAELLGLPVPGQPKSTQHRATKSETQFVELPALPQPPSELPASARDSRSRYRPVSAPNSRNISPGGSQPINGLLPNSLDIWHRSEQSVRSSHTTHFAGTPTARLQVAPTFAPAKSMPNLNAGFLGPVPSSGFAQPYFMNGGVPFQHVQQQFHVSPIEMSATPAPYNPGQDHLKSQLGLGGDYLIPQMRGNPKPPIMNHPIPPNPRTAFPGPQQARVELSGTPKLQSQKGSLHVVSCEGESAPVQQHVPDLEEVTDRLHLVGAERLYQAPLKPKKRSQEPIGSVPNQSPFIFELDTTPQTNNMLAELSADIDAALQINGDDRPQPLSKPIQPQVHNKPTVEDSPVSPPDSHTPVATSTSQYQVSINRPPNPPTQSAPLSALPPSLMAGGLSVHASHNRIPSNSSSLASSQTAPDQLPATKTNASRYSRYYSPPSSAPNSNHASPQLTPAVASQYKAYQPPSMSSSPPALQQHTAAPDERSGRSSSFGALKDVDGAQHYFQTHNRDASHDSHASSASHDSSKLAQEYQAALPDFETGYSSNGEVA